MRDKKAVKVVMIIKDDNGRVFLTENTIIRELRTPGDRFCIHNAFMNGIRDNLKYFEEQLEGYSITRSWRIYKKNKFYRFINVILKMLEEK